MAEDHRRVETRSIIGTGMVNDPDRLAQIANDAARTERAWREPPPEGFGSVLERSPARGEMEDAVVADRRRKAPADAVAEPAPDAATPTTPSPKTAAPKTNAPQRLSPRAPDPREKMLRAQLATASSTPPVTSSSSSSSPRSAGETPPTGSVAPLPRGGR